MASRVTGSVSPPSETSSEASALEACGFRKVPATGDDASDWDQYTLAATQKTGQRWRESLLDSSDIRGRAIGLVLQRFEANQNGFTVQADESRDELVQLAVGGGDPAVYAIAAGACQTGLSDPVTTGACQRLSLTEWARLDSGNAVPWIAVAEAARTRGDVRAEAVAFAKAAESRKIDNFSESMLSFGLAEVPRDALPVERFSLTIELVGQEAAWGRPELSEIMRYCSVAAVKQEDVHKECSAIAELLVGPGTTLLYYSIGGKLGDRVGWPAERVRQVAAEKDTLLQLEADMGSSLGSCDSISRVNAFTVERERVGELEALRELKEQREHAAPATVEVGAPAAKAKPSPPPPAR
jgi:hypothetical protein